MNSTNKSPTLNPMARQEVYMSPKLYPLNKVYSIDSSDDSDTNSTPLFSSNDSLSSFEDYRINVDLEENKNNNIFSTSECNRGIMSSICCSWWCARS